MTCQLDPAEAVSVRRLLAPVLIGPHTALYPEFVAHVLVGDHHRAHIDVHVVDGQPVPVSLTLEAADPKAPVTPGHLRQLAGALAGLVEQAAAKPLVHVIVDEATGNWTGYQGGPEDVAALLDRTRAKRRRVTQELLAEVATVYAEAGDSAAAVQAHFAVSQRTSFRWVQLARQQGLIAGEGA